MTVLGVLPVPFTASCPACRSDAKWVAYMRRLPNGAAVGPGHHIDCPRCGPCPCAEHETIKGVAA